MTTWADKFRPSNTQPEPLLPCPLCGKSNITNMGTGIGCRDCGLWLGEARVRERGGVRLAWNTRHKTTEAEDIAILSGKAKGAK